MVRDSEERPQSPLSGVGGINIIREKCPPRGLESRFPLKIRNDSLLVVVFVLCLFNTFRPLVVVQAVVDSLPFCLQRSLQL